MRRNALGSVCFLAILVCVMCRDAAQKPVIGNQVFARSHSRKVRRADEQESPQISVDDISRSGNPIYDSWEDYSPYGLPGNEPPVYYGSVYPQGYSNAHADASTKAENNGYLGYEIDEPGYLAGQSYGQSLAESDSHAYSESNAQSNAYGLDQSDAYATSSALSEAQSNTYGSGQSDAYAVSSAHSEAQNTFGIDHSGSYASSNAQSVALSNARGQSDVYSASNAQSVAHSNLYGVDQSDAYATSNAQSVAQNNVYGLDQSHAFASSNVISQSNAYSLDKSEAYAASNAQSQSNDRGLGHSDTYVSSNAQALSHSDAHAASSAQSVAHSNIRGQGHHDAYSVSNAESLAQSNSHSDAYASSSAQADYYKEPVLEIPMHYQYGQDLIKPVLLRALGSVLDEPLQYGDHDLSAHSSAYAFAGAHSRLIPHEEHVRPHSLPGGKDIIHCSKEGEIFQLWIPVIGCTVCVCVREGYHVEPHCVKCDCTGPQHGVAPAIVEPVAMQPVIPAPPPQPESQVSCDPLPEDTPFENPVNPCQICVCRRSINMGHPDIDITCEENPECLVHPEPLPQPQSEPEPLPQPQPEPEPLPQPQPEPKPRPETQPQPIPIPEPEIVPQLHEPADGICQEYPLDVPFQDPEDACSICICTIQHSQYKVTCQPDPACEVRPFIVPEVIHPQEPLPLPIPEPQPSPPEQPELVPHPAEPIPEPYTEIVPYPEPVNPEPAKPEPIPEYAEFIPNNIPSVYPQPAPHVIHTVEPIPEPNPEPYPEKLPQPYPELEQHQEPDTYPVPEPEQIPEIEVPEVLPVPVPKMRPDAPEDLPEPVPWPPAVPSPLPGPPPHESCHPYPPNTPFQHPWDVCQICVCTEVTTENVINVEVNCYTSKLCCIEPSFSGPVVQPLGISGPPTSNSAPAHIKFIDKICEQRSLEVEFVNPNDACKTCKCELYGNLVVPVCKRTHNPECAVTPLAPVSPSGDVVYIEPRCRYRVPSQYFRVEGSICVCEPIYRYVIAKCVKLPLNAGSASRGENKVIPSYSTAPSNAVSFWQRPINTPIPSNLPGSSYLLPSQSYETSPYSYWLQTYPGMVNIQPKSQITPSNDLYHQLNYVHPSDGLYPSYLRLNNYEQPHAVAQAVAESSEGYHGHVEPNDHYIGGSNAYINVGKPNLDYGSLHGWNPYSHLQSPALNGANQLHINAISNAEANVPTNPRMNAYYYLPNNNYASDYLGPNNGQHSIPYGFYNNYGNVINNQELGRYNLDHNSAHATAETVEEVGQWDTQAVIDASAQASGAQSNAQAHTHSNVNMPYNGELFVEDDALANTLANVNRGLAYPHRFPQTDVLLPGYVQTNAEVNALANARAKQNHALAYPPLHPQNLLLPGYPQSNTEVNAKAIAQATHDYGLAYPYYHPQNDIYSQAHSDSHSQSEALSNAMAKAHANIAVVDQLTDSLANVHASSSAKAQSFSHSNAHANSLSHAQANAYGDLQASAQANALSNAKTYQQNSIRDQRPSSLGTRQRLNRNRWRYFDKSGANPDDNESVEEESAENGREEPTRFDLPDILTPVSIVVKSTDKAEDETMTTRAVRHDASEVFDYHLTNKQYENTAVPVTVSASTPLQYRRSANSESSTSPTPGLPVTTSSALQSTTGYSAAEESTLTTSFPTFGTTRSQDIKDSIDAVKCASSAKKGRSTSSSSGERGSRSSKGTVEDSLELSIDTLSSSKSREDSEEKNRDIEEKPKGWRKYHRACPPCPKDMEKKPTDKSISWVCGGYQRARRTFKSVCMMRLRNCEDGTMFVKLYDGICKTPRYGSAPGDHFFYDIKEKDSEDLSKFSDLTDSSESKEDKS